MGDKFIAMFFALNYGSIFLIGPWSNYQSMKIVQQGVSESYGISLDLL